RIEINSASLKFHYMPDTHTGDSPTFKLVNLGTRELILTRNSTRNVDFHVVFKS
ncbi:hypothetical protein L9F63_016050, partial [Diploptera punctata]